MDLTHVLESTTRYRNQRGRFDRRKQTSALGGGEAEIEDVPALAASVIDVSDRGPLLDAAPGIVGPLMLWKRVENADSDVCARLECRAFRGNVRPLTRWPSRLMPRTLFSFVMVSA
jgi:hypothetical protein